MYFARKLPTIVVMNIESRFGANKGGQQPSEMLYLAKRENALLGYTLDRQIFEEIPYEMTGNYAVSNRFWSKNRSYRKQTTKPCLTGTRIAQMESQLSWLGKPNLGTSRSLGTPQIRHAASSQIATKYRLFHAQPPKTCVVHLESGATVRSHEA